MNSIRINFKIIFLFFLISYNGCSAGAFAQLGGKLEEKLDQFYGKGAVDRILSGIVLGGGVDFLFTFFWWMPTVGKVPLWNRLAFVFAEKVINKQLNRKTFFEELYARATDAYFYRRSKLCVNLPKNYSFNIVGYEADQKKIRNIIDIFARTSSDQFIHPGHILVYGPPGTGKTKLIAQALADAEVDFVNVTFSLLKDNPIKYIPRIFSKLSDKKTVYFFDEFDGFVPPSKLKRMLSEEEEKKLAFWKQIFDSNDPLAKNRLIICTSNHKEYFDESLLRPGRLENQYEIGLPHEQDRLLIFRSKCWEYRIPSITDLTDEEIIEKTKGYSGAQIDKFVRLLRITSQRRGGFNSELDKKDFNQVIF